MGYLGTHCPLQFVNVVPLQGYQLEVRVYPSEVDQGIQRDLMQVIVRQQQ